MRPKFDEIKRPLETDIKGRNPHDKDLAEARIYQKGIYCRECGFEAGELPLLSECPNCKSRYLKVIELEVFE